MIYIFLLRVCVCFSFSNNVYCRSVSDDNGNNSPSFISRLKSSFVEKINNVFKKRTDSNCDNVNLPKTYIVNSDADLKKIILKIREIREQRKKGPIKVILKESS